ncbi:MAG: transketolase [Candidatus Thiodiazotropha sp.]
MSHLSALKVLGQSFWLDNLSRSMLKDGSLAQRIEQQSLSGITSNPAIFQKSISQSELYDDDIARDIREGLSLQSIYRNLVIDDVVQACDLLRPVYDGTQGRDGYVSLEVSPHLAYDAQGTLREAQMLWERVAHPNLMIKVPGTRVCMPVIEELLYRGININITLLFSLEAYWNTFHAYQNAQDRRSREGKPLAPVTSVASFFLSRIDVAADALLRERIQDDTDISELARSLLGRTAIANAKLAYASFQALMMSSRWTRLEEQGARPQRLLWASTGTKDPAYSDVMYIEPLIGPHTVSTMPNETADAFDTHGEAALTVEQELNEAHKVMQGLQRLGIDLESLTARLLEEGIQKFIDPYESTLELLRTRRDDSSDNRPDIPMLKSTAKRLRADVIRMTTTAGSGHPTSSLSCADIMAALFFHEMRWDPARPEARDVDRFILSKGHAAPILWSVLREAGAIHEKLDTLRRMDSTLEGHPTPTNPWIPIATGSLGQGLAAANGIALANRLDGIDSRVYCLLGDGECSEGSVWEAAQFASLQGLEALVAIVDVNGLEQSGLTPYGGNTTVLAERFRAFGWRSLEIDGHDMPAIIAALQMARDDGPTAILARTQKGKGVSFLEGMEGWHGKVLDDTECDKALAEIGDTQASHPVEPRHVDAYLIESKTSYANYGVDDYRRGDEVATRTAFGLALAKLGESIPDLVVLDGDVKNSTKTEQFASAFPTRFFETHIAEQNMIGTALGLAVSAKVPVSATFAAFLTRAHDFIRMAGHSRPPHMVICGSHAGVSIGADGPSQMGLDDLAMFRAIDGCSILYPSDAVSASRLTALAVFTDGIVYLRTTRGKTPVIYGPQESFELGGSKTLASSEHDRLTLVAAGITVHTALQAHRLLRQRGIQSRVIDAYSVEPLDVKTLEQAARETGTLLVIEDHHLRGGLGDAVSSQVGRLGRVFRMGITGEPHSGTPEELFEHHHISVDAVTREAAGVVM